MEKAIIFDFDGTLTKDSPNIWKQIWKTLGYDMSRDSYFATLFKQFISKEITHDEWTNLTRDKFIERGFDKDTFTALASQTHLIDGANQTLKGLKQRDCSINILSGGVDQVIRRTLKSNVSFFDYIQSNKFIFGTDGKLKDIDATDYDFEGKAVFIKMFCEKHDISPQQVCFIGNGDNDEWAHKSGCRTICINAEDTDDNNKSIWHQTLGTIDTLEKVLPVVDEIYKDN